LLIIFSSGYGIGATGDFGTAIVDFPLVAKTHGPVSWTSRLLNLSNKRSRTWGASDARVLSKVFGVQLSPFVITSLIPFSLYVPVGMMGLVGILVFASGYMHLGGRLVGLERCWLDKVSAGNEGKMAVPKVKGMTICADLEMRSCMASHDMAALGRPPFLGGMIDE
jgi:hypothetical protein